MILGAILRTIGFACFALCAPAACLAGEVSGAGATFPYPIYAKWAAAYHAETGATINYQPVGSGLGIKLIKSKAVTFGASDMPMKPQDLEASSLIQFPTVIGGDVPVVNLPGIKAGEMALDGTTLADIYLGKIKSWSDPAIRRYNPSLSLPSTPITVVHRSDGSGTTFIWCDYLSKSRAEWKRNVGADTAVEWPIGVGAKGNEGVASTVGETPGAIGYVEYTYAIQHTLAFTKVFNSSGRAVSPSLDSFRAAAAAANWAASPGFYIILTDQPGADAWPITGATFILMQKSPADPVASNDALKFFHWAFAKGDQAALQLNYVPLPDDVVTRIEVSWKQIQGAP